MNLSHFFYIPPVIAAPVLQMTLSLIILAIWLLIGQLPIVQSSSSSTILVVGSANADTFLPVARLPTEGETLTLLPGSQPVVDLPGGKGCTQAVAVSKLTDKKCCFVGQVGEDSAGTMLVKAMKESQVDCSHCTIHRDFPSGRGYVFLTQSGSASAIVSGGSNADGWKAWEKSYYETPESDDDGIRETYWDDLLKNVECILLQREVPEYVNLLIASHAKRCKADIVVMQDVGGEDRPISSEMLGYCDYIVPNESELKRLVHGMGMMIPTEDSDDDELIVRLATFLQSKGAKNVLVTRGSNGSTLLTEDGRVIHQRALRLPKAQVVDETGAGDCYRAAFAVALLEGHSLEKCMQFANAAGSLSVEVNGAVPSAPNREDVESRLLDDSLLDIPRGGSSDPVVDDDGDNGDDEGDFPFLIGSRLNSMKDRPELWSVNPPGSRRLSTPADYVQRQATVRGVTCVDFNYPQHFHTWTTAEAKRALDDAGLVAGAVCLRYPSPTFARGAMNHPDPTLRRDAIELTKQAAAAAMELGCHEVVVWSAFDGYDYPLQVDYDRLWQQLIDAFQEICDAYPQIKFSLEYKPTDENTRFFTVPSTAAALLLVEEIDRPNMGLTLDVGHLLMSGENPGQSIAQVGRRQKLFGIQLNDGYTRLAAEDGLMFGSVHPSMALEIMYQLRRTGFSGHVYFDTFPQRTDPVKEAEYNIRQVKRFYKAAGAMDDETLRRVVDDHDAIGALELVNAALRSM
jgi:ribokinase